MAITGDKTHGRLVRADPDHRVVLYASQIELVGSVGAYLEQGLRAGDAVVVLATPAHREAFSDRLTQSGLEVERSRADGSLTMQDAVETLSLFMADGRPDPTRFATSMRAILSRAQAGGRSVRVFGEMVAVLWEAGQVTAGMDIESLWNELLRGTSASLLCAYPLDTLGSDAAATAEMCRLHSDVLRRPSGGNLPARRASVPVVARSFAGVLDDVTRARHFVVDALFRSGQEPMADKASLVVTELAANAVLHARSAFTVTVSRTSGGIEIAVSDAGPLVPRLTDPATFESTGRGLRIVTELATRWGTSQGRSGKVVWAELCRPRSS